MLWRGAEMYRAEAKNKETISKFGHGTPNDWIERNLYTRYSWQGVALMLIINMPLWLARGGTLAMTPRPRQKPRRLSIFRQI